MTPPPVVILSEAKNLTLPERGAPARYGPLAMAIVIVLV
jgi:hypothetical protein